MTGPETALVWDALQRIPDDLLGDPKFEPLLVLRRVWTPAHAVLLELLWQTTPYYAIEFWELVRRSSNVANLGAAPGRVWESLHGVGVIECPCRVGYAQLSPLGVQFCQSVLGKHAYRFPPADLASPRCGQAGVCLHNVTQTRSTDRCRSCGSVQVGFFYPSIADQFFFCAGCSYAGVAGWSYKASPVADWCLPHPDTGELLSGGAP